MFEWIGFGLLVGLTGNWRGYRMGGKAIGGSNMSTDMKKKFEQARAAGDMDKAKAMADKVQKFNDAKRTEKASPIVGSGTHEDGLQRNRDDWQQQLDKYAKDKGIQVSEVKDRIYAIQDFSNYAYDSIRRDQKNGRPNEQATHIENFIRDGNPYAGTIYRGISFDSAADKAAFIARFKDGKMNTEALSSWSSSLDIAKRFGEKKGQAESLIMQSRKNKSGVSIKGISEIQNEDEVLVASRKNFKIVDVKQSPSGQTMLILDEE